MTTTFIGIDLAWQSDKNHSGIVILRGDTAGAALVERSVGIADLEGVVTYVLHHATANTVVAIDAPLIIANSTGQRPCELHISKRFGQFHASAHASNLTLYPNPGSVQIASHLAQHGFTHASTPVSDRQRRGHWFFEVYPHPAQVVLFNLSRIIKYKKGRVSQRRQGLEALRQQIDHVLPMANPPLQPNHALEVLIEQDLSLLQGRALKQYEDTLDALICAYLALFYWTWGDEKTEMIGDLHTGYIINPTMLPGG